VERATTNELKELERHHNLVKASCVFDYLAEKLTLKFESGCVTFKPKSVKIFFQKQSISCVQYGDVERRYKPKDVFSIDVSFRNVPIDFFGFSNRKFSILFGFEASTSLTFHLNFSIALPIVKQSELFFKPPGTTYPDPITRCICQQAFKMNPTNSDEEINRCIILEEFKLMSAVERYKAYGYITMLDQFLHIENSFELDLVQKFNLNNAIVHQINAIHYKIDVS
jgi:hypothetical protein